MKITDFKDSLSYRLSKYLEDCGFKTSDWQGEVQKTYHESCEIGIVDRGSSERCGQFRNFLHKLFGRPNKYRGIFLGVISFYSAPEDKWWIRVQGRRNLPTIKKLVIKLEEDFDVQINIEIISDQLKFESFADENGW